MQTFLVGPTDGSGRFDFYSSFYYIMGVREKWPHGPSVVRSESTHFPFAPKRAAVTGLEYLIATVYSRMKVCSVSAGDHENAHLTGRLVFTKSSSVALTSTNSASRKEGLLMCRRISLKAPSDS